MYLLNPIFSFKDIRLPQNENFLKYFFSIMFASYLIITQCLRIIWKIKAVFRLF